MPLTLRDRGLLNGDDIPRTTEILSFDETTESILSFDDDFDEFSRKLQQLSKEWEASSLRESQLLARVLSRQTASRRSGRPAP